MKYLAQTFSYLKKCFWLPLVVMIIPSTVAGMLSTTYWEVAFVAKLDFDPYIPLSSMFAVIFGDSWKYAWPVVIVCLFQILGASLVMSAMDGHFRTGRLTLRRPFALINYSVFAIAIGIIAMCAVSIIWRFVLFGLVSFVKVLFQTLGVSAGGALSVISVIAVALFVVHVLIITPMLYWGPVMFVYGYKFRDAAAMTFKLLSGKRVFIGLFLPLLLCAAIMLLVCFLQPPLIIWRTVSGTTFLVTNMYVPVYVMTSFYSISGLDRRDKLPYEISLPSVPSATLEQIRMSPPAQPVRPAASENATAAEPQSESAAPASSKSKSAKAKPKSAQSKKPAGKKQANKQGDKPVKKQNKTGAGKKRGAAADAKADANSGEGSDVV